MANEPELRRCHAWQRRLALPVEGGPLGLYAELWADLTDHPAAQALQRLGRDVPPYYITRTLLLDLVHAACGVEFHSERVLAALDRPKTSRTHASPKTTSSRGHPTSSSMF